MTRLLVRMPFLNSIPGDVATRSARAEFRLGKVCASVVDHVDEYLRQQFSAASLSTRVSMPRRGFRQFRYAIHGGIRYRANKCHAMERAMNSRDARRDVDSTHTLGAILKSLLLLARFASLQHLLGFVGHRFDSSTVLRAALERLGSHVLVVFLGI